MLVPAFKALQETGTEEVSKRGRRVQYANAKHIRGHPASLGRGSCANQICIDLLPDPDSQCTSFNLMSALTGYENTRNRAFIKCNPPCLLQGVHAPRSRIQAPRCATLRVV